MDLQDSSDYVGIPGGKRSAFSPRWVCLKFACVGPPGYTTAWFSLKEQALAGLSFFSFFTDVLPFVAAVLAVARLCLGFRCRADCCC